MSWFKHKPRPKSPTKLHAHHISPITEKLLKETKREVTGVIAKVEEQDPVKKKKNDK